MPGRRADQIADLGVADGPRQVVAQDLEGTGRQPLRQRIQRLLDIPGGQLPELDVAQRFPQQLDCVPVKLPGPVRPAAQPASQPTRCRPFRSR